MARIASAGMRRGAMGAWFEKSAAGDVARDVDALVRRAMAGGADALTVALDLATWLVAARAPSSLADDPARPGRLRAIGAVRDEAEQRGLAAAAAILAEGRASRSLPRHGRLAEVCVDVEAPMHLVPWWPLFARRNKDLLERLLVHHDARMIRRVLALRALRDKDVARIASRRPTSPEIARAVALSPRWMASLEVRTALATNPFTPVDIAAPILPVIKASALRLIARSGLVTGELAIAAKALLALVEA
jgi:hypothetical protein